MTGVCIMLGMILAALLIIARNIAMLSYNITLRLEEMIRVHIGELTLKLK